MKEYKVYFEIFGKKMRVTVPAETITEAKKKVINKIKWHKVINKDDGINDLIDSFDNIMNKIK